MYAATVNDGTENQHWISQVLLERFKVRGQPLQCFQVQTGEWEPKGLSRTCASPGYNQLVVAGQIDDSLEAAFSKIESGLPKTLKTLEHSASTGAAELPRAALENLCWYCAFLKLVSPISKPGAVVSFLFQINWELEHGRYDLLRDLDVPEAMVESWRAESRAGRKLVVDSDNVLQLLYRFQFRRNYGLDYRQFLATRWILSTCPHELPLSDVGIVPMYLSDQKATHYMLPISPYQVLEGIIFNDPRKNEKVPPFRSLALTPEEAEYRLDCICASAVMQVICSKRLLGIPESIARAKKKGVTFQKIIQPHRIASAGLNEVGERGLTFRWVSIDEYVRFVHSFIQPNA
jgi:hypothetical protein